MPSAKVLILIGTLSVTIGAMANPLDSLSKDKPVCFGHHYTATEIQSRPKQTVRELKLQFHVDEYSTAQTPLLHISANLKKSNGKIGRYRNDMLCTADSEGVQCSVECDGGSAEIKWAREITDGSVEFVNKGFVLYGGCDEEDETKTVFLTPTANGNDMFNLEPMECD
jgi:hypothetical protein